MNSPQHWYNITYYIINKRSKKKIESTELNENALNLSDLFVRCLLLKQKTKTE